MVLSFWAVCGALTAINLFACFIFSQRQPVLIGVPMVYPDHDKALQRSIALLLSWLTPMQRRQYESRNYFDVIGSAGGRYRVNGAQHGSVMPFNVDCLSAAPKNALCFVPKQDTYMEPNLPAGDILLTQKLWLETDEPAVLAVCNWRTRYNPDGSVFTWFGNGPYVQAAPPFRATMIVEEVGVQYTTARTRVDRAIDGDGESD